MQVLGWFPSAAAGHCLGGLCALALDLESLNDRPRLAGAHLEIGAPKETAVDMAAHVHDGGQTSATRPAEQVVHQPFYALRPEPLNSRGITWFEACKQPTLGYIVGRDPALFIADHPYSAK